MSQDDLKSTMRETFGRIEPMTSRELPKYRCHKEVWALKIKSVERLLPTIEELDAILNGGEEKPGGMITPADDRYAPFSVTTEYMNKHNPQPGGYYVVYTDDYKSFSPSEAFEGGYTLIR